ncbi:MAG: 50S ribosomal protein L6 [Candidatus Omnitrophica bacterium]|nr:50S ribosomal protein L6 [Candidatus Omnitrophota bacterium]
MSRIGRKLIDLPQGVKIEIKDNSVLVEGPKGKISLDIPYLLKVESKDNKISVTRSSETKKIRSLHGTIRALINNMVIGVSSGFKKEMEVIGMGYKTQLKGDTLVLQIGFSHPVEFLIPKDLKVTTPGVNKITVEGINKHTVGQFAAKVRKIYPPEPYKGKGIRYLREVVRKKLGKAMAK